MEANSRGIFKVIMQDKTNIAYKTPEITTSV